MWYSIRRVYQRIRKSKFIYCILIFEIAVGITFITYSLNQFYSALERQKVLEKMLANETVSLKIYKKSSSSSQSNEMAISYEDYKHIQKITSEKSTYYVVKNDSGFSEENIVDIKIVYTDIGRNEFNNDIALYGKNLKDNLTDASLGNFDFIEIRDQKLIELDSKKEYRLKILPHKYEKIILPKSLIDRDVKLNDCILLPMESYKNFRDEDLSNFMLFIDLNSKDNSEKILSDVLNYLRKEHGQFYTYELNNPIDEYRKSSESLTELSRYFGRMSIIMLSILIIGFTGIVKIFMKKREKELAINMALGASKKILVFELFLEVVLICYTGVIVGILIGNLLTLNVEMSVFDVMIHFKSIIICISIGLIISTSITLSSIKKILKMKPIELLKAL